jgi:hypothetical protein
LITFFNKLAPKSLVTSFANDVARRSDSTLLAAQKSNQKNRWGCVDLPAGRQAQNRR